MSVTPSNNTKCQKGIDQDDHLRTALHQLRTCGNQNNSEER